MDDYDSYLFPLFVITLLVTIFFSFLRTVISNIPRQRLKALCAENSANAEKLQKMLTSPVSLSLIIKSLHSLSLLLCGIIAGLETFRNILHGASSFNISLLWILAAAVMILSADLIFSKTLIAVSDKIALRIIKVYSFFYKASYPLFALLLFVFSPFLPKESEVMKAYNSFTENDFLFMVNEASEQGLLEEEEKEMIHSVFEMSTTTAREIMTPRLDIIAVEQSMALGKVLEIAMEHGYSRLPVYENSIDKITGIVHTKDLITPLRENKMDQPLGSCMRKPFFIPDNRKIDEMLKDMQKDKIAMAIVVDEYGGTDGLVTMEDIIEEIVGDITDEYDKETEPLRQLEDGSYIIPGKTTIEEVNELFDTDISDEEFDTIGGMIYGITGHIPVEGESVTLENLRITVEKVNRQRILTVKVGKAQEETREK